MSPYKKEGAAWPSSPQILLASNVTVKHKGVEIKNGKENPVFNKFKTIPHDKLLHFFSGSLVANSLVIAVMAWRWATDSPLLFNSIATAILLAQAVIVTVAVGALKELFFDADGRGTQDAKDFYWTVAGAWHLIPFAIFLIFA